MADEFAKGLGIATTAGLGWMVLSGWFTTPGFEEAQLVGEVSIENPDVYAQLALVAREALFWFAILGILVFWVLIPGIREIRRAYGKESESG